MDINSLNSKFNLIKLNHKLSKFKSTRGVNKGYIIPTLVSKFSNKTIKSDLDIKIPMKTKVRFFKTGETRDGVITLDDLKSSISKWKNKTIIDWHNMDDMKSPTNFKLSDIKGFIGNNPTIIKEGNTYWIESDAYITNRELAYAIYIRELNGEEIEVSPEFRYTPIIGTDGIKYQTNIRPELLTIVTVGDVGHLQGNFMKVAEA